MKCWEFKELVSDLACDRLMDEGLRSRAISHLADCEPCDQQLSSQRRLNRELQVFAEETGTLRASTLVKARVREELRAAVAESGSPAPVISINAYRKPVDRKWFLAAAAALLAVCGISITLWQKSSTPNRNAPVETTTALTPSPIPGTPELVTPTSLPAASDFEKAKKGRLAGSERRNRRRSVQGSENLAINVSEFVPLTLSTDEKAIENGTIVRIKAPRAQLVAMGLPLRVENEADTINADVMLGDNGVAYAIRVVRE
jgi:hypothetical protein